MVIIGKWQDGTPMLAIPNYARMNRVAHDRPAFAGDGSVNYSSGATASTANSNANANANSLQGSTTPGAATQVPAQRRRVQRKIDSKVWMQSLA